MKRRAILVFAASLCLVSCDAPPTPSASAIPEGPTQPPETHPAATLPPTTPPPSPPPAAGAGVLLAEVGFAHDVQPAFIELWNAGDAPSDLRDIGLSLDGMPLPFMAPLEPLAPDGRFVVLFDFVLGEVPLAGPAHLLADQAPKVAGGVLDLLDVFGQPIDHVAWGDAPDPVRTGLGGVVPQALEPQWSIGRVPGAKGAHDRLAWVPYAEAERTPAEPNLLPRVPVILPFSGAVFDSPAFELHWYPVAGATGYRVQIATDPTFGTLVRDEASAGTGLQVADFAAGAYAWRVQASSDGGHSSAFTDPATFEVEIAAAGAALAVARPGASRVLLAAVEPDAQKRLAVPLIEQHKDTSMLLLERNVRNDTHPWDQDHGVLDKQDPSDNTNCVLASVAMISAYACPTCHMRQDRIGYEVFKGRLPGPERDMNYGDGLLPNEMIEALDFAIVTANTRLVYDTVPDRIWATVRAQIDAGKPLLVSRSNGGGGLHATVVTGYRVRGGRRVAFANDPWTNREETYVIANSSAAGPTAEAWWMYPINGALLGRQQELSVAEDSDGDEVVDFDETERFHTDPNEVDTDEDGLHDKQDILLGVFDDYYGYAVGYRLRSNFPPMDGRDYDRDGLATELDRDSDNGGCLDGDEDKSLDGIYDHATETWNFEASDDPCRPLSGSLYWRETNAVGSDESWGKSAETATFSIRLKPDPDNPRFLFVDDGSSYSYVGRSTSFTKGIEGCDFHGLSLSAGGGAYAPGGLHGGIVTEYEPGQDGLGLSLFVEFTGQSTLTTCLGSETSSQAGSTAPQSCVGLEDPDDGIPGRTFVFNCVETLGVGWFGRTYELTGSIVIQ